MTLDGSAHLMYRRFFIITVIILTCFFQNWFINLLKPVDEIVRDRLCCAYMGMVEEGREVCFQDLSEKLLDGRRWMSNELLKNRLENWIVLLLWLDLDA